MRSLLDDVSSVDDVDAVGVEDRRQPVRDGKGRPAHHELVERRLHDLLALRIERRRRLVEDQNAWILQDGACDRDALTLTARKIQAAFTDLRLISFGKLQDEFLGVRRTRCLLDLLVRRVEPAVADVFAHTARKEHRFLRHDADLLAQGVERHVAHVVTVDLDHAFVHLVETRDEIRDRRLARARRADEGDELSGARLKRHMRECGSALLVGKGHVLDGDAPFNFGQRNGPFLVMNRLFHVDHVKDAIGRRHRTLHGAVDAADALDRVREIHGIRQKRNESARRQITLHDLVAADPQDKGDRDRREELHGRCQEARELHVLHLGLEI